MNIFFEGKYNKELILFGEIGCYMIENDYFSHSPQRLLTKFPIPLEREV